jgi:hypothetical protein
MFICVAKIHANTELIFDLFLKTSVFTVTIDCSDTKSPCVVDPEHVSNGTPVIPQGFSLDVLGGPIHDAARDGCKKVQTIHL